MAENPLSALATQLKAGASRPDGVLLDMAYLTSALGQGVTLPEGLDSRLAQVFQTGGPGGLTIVLTQAVFGTVTTQFEVSSVALTVLGGATTTATLTFGLQGEGDQQSLTLQIVSPTPNWRWSDLASPAVGWPFSGAPVAEVTWTFDTLVGGATQAFVGQLQTPAFFNAVVELVLEAPSAPLALSGVLDFGQTDGHTTFFPIGVLTAPIPSSGDLTLFHLSVANPAFVLTFPTPEEDGDQAPVLAFQLDLSVSSGGKPVVGYRLTASVAPQPGPLGRLLMSSPPTLFSFGLSSGPDGVLLTPATLMELVGGASYFAAAPAQFQQFLTLIGLRGLSISGTIDPPQILQLGATVGANPKTLPWVLFKDEANGLVLEIDDLELQWALTGPLGPHAQQTASFSTQLTFLPSVFKGGVFQFEITTDLEFDARFTGTAELGDLISVASAGLISLPSSVSGALSDVRFHYSHASGAYAFSTGIAVDLKFITIDGYDLFKLTNARLALSARPPRTKGGATAYQALFGGLVQVGGVAAFTSIAYQSDTGWTLSAAAAAPIALGALIEDVFTLGGQYAFPDFLPTDITIETLAVTAVIPQASTEASSYAIQGSFDWDFKLGKIQISQIEATIDLTYAAKDFSGSIAAQLTLPWLSGPLDVGYVFDRAKGSSTLSIGWEGITADYASGDETLKFTFADCSVGSLITALVKTIGDPYFALPAPWDLLNELSLDGLEVDFALAKDSSTPISATYTFGSTIELGFASISGITLSQQKVGEQSKIIFQLDGDSPLLDLPGVDPKLKNLFHKDGAAAGQPIDDMPKVPGRGSESFKLMLLAMGQRVSVAGLLSAPDVKTVIADLQTVPSTDGATNPVVAGGGPNSPVGTPYYDRSADWLIAAHMLFLKAGDDWTIDLSFVFHDADLYGLHLETSGAKAKALAGLVLDVLYKKITDEIGLYQVDWRFPDSVRNLNFGSVSVTLPDIGVQIYTNGDFLIDIGFPYKLDFSRSFSFCALIAEVPVTGAGGVYFGKLSGATSTFTPPSKLGTFDPVIAFGLGFQIGLGYSFTAGPLSAGFSLTAFALVEGVIATWKPYSLPAPANSSVQHDYYFKITGVVGVIGLLYGSVDFAIIKASLSVNITLSLSLTYESFAPIDITAHASVSVSLKVSIDLGLFSITFHLSFHAEASASFVIHVDDGAAPWLSPSDSVPLLGGPARPLRVDRPRPRGQAKPVLRQAGQIDALNLYATVAYTVLAAEGQATAADQTGAFVTLLMMDAPSASSAQAFEARGCEGPSSFETLCRDLLPWLVDHLSGARGEVADLARAADTVVSPDLLEHYMGLMADLDDPPLGFGDYLTFLSSFAVYIIALDQTTAPALANGSATFPVFDGLLATPIIDGAAGAQIDFSQWTSASPGYRQGVAEIFSTLSASLQQAGAPASNLVAPAKSEDGAPVAAESMAALLFVDGMMVIGRQLLQAAREAFQGFQYPLANGNTIAAILAWAQASETPITSDNIVLANAETPLAGGDFTLQAPPYVVRDGDTLSMIAASFPSEGQISAASLIAGNPHARVIVAGAAIPYGANVYLTEPAMSFHALLAKLGALDPAQPLNTPWTPEQLAGALGTLSCLVPGGTLVLPGKVSVAQGDTLGRLAARYGVTVSALGSEATNQGVTLFDTTQQATIGLANIVRAKISDLWSNLVADDRLAQAAGMLSRFLASGLRLPVSTDQGALELSAAFSAANPKQARYGLCQLTGQQFAATTLAPSQSYGLALSRLAEIGGIDLGFISFGGGGQSVMVDLLAPFGQLAPVLAAARSGVFDPKTEFAVLSAVARTPQTHGLGTGVGFVVTDPAILGLITQPLASQIAASSPIRQPMLWTAPASLLAAASAQQARLQAAGVAYVDQLPYLQQLQPLAVTVDPTTKASIQTDLDRYAWATRVVFSIKRAPNGAAGAGAAKTRAYTYEILGLTAAQAQLLQGLVTGLSAQAPGQGLSGAFLAYQQGSGAQALLLALSNAANPSFFSRTNLSTQSHPERDGAEAFEASPPPMGNIANPPEQVAQLLWELSTVRSGGYFLVCDHLPDAIFDSSGKADLSVVFTYPRGGALTADRLTGFVNALLVDDPLAGAGVRVALTAESAPAAAQDASAVSLAFQADLYGLSVGRVAELNPQFPLLPAVTLSIAGAIHLVVAADVGSSPTQTWDTIAAAYGATLTGAAVAQANPGVEPSIGAAVYIPTFSYQTADGDTLAILAKRFGISVDDLATAGAGAPMLTTPSLGAGVQLQIDPQALDVRPSDASGNIAFTLTRPAPDVTPEGVLEQLYSVLGVGLESNRFFAAAQGAPLGPQHHEDGRDPMTTRRSAERRRRLRHPLARRQALQAMLEEPLTYRTTLGAAAVATLNLAPAGGGALPPASANPYVGVGGLAQLQLEWRDLFGNILVDQFAAPPSDYDGARSGQPLGLAYRDKLIGPGAWPGVAIQFLYEAGQLSLMPAFSTKAYEPAPSGVEQTPGDMPAWQVAAQRDYGLYSQVWFQLNQDYSSAGVPWASGQAVSFTLRNSLLATPLTLLSDAQAQPLRDFVAAILTYLDNRRQGQPGAAPQVAPMTFDIDIDADLVVGDVLPLALTLIAQRQPLLVDSGLAGLADGETASVDLLPQPNANETGASGYSDFAEKFEAMFVSATGTWSMRVGMSGAASAASSGGASGSEGDQRTQSLWALRMASSPLATVPQGLGFSLADFPLYYAPLPLATSLLTTKVTLYPSFDPTQPFPPSGQTPVTQTITGVDPGVWFQTVLDAIDTLLSPDLTAALYLLDLSTGVADPLSDGKLGQLLAIKQSLADSIASTVRPILQPKPGRPDPWPAPSAASAASASNALRQALLNKLGPAFATTAIVAFPADRVAGPTSGDGPVNLYGQPRIVPGAAQGASDNTTYAFSSARLSLDPAQSTWLSFLLESRNQSNGAAYLPLNLEWSVTHLEHAIRAVPGIDGYVDSDWIGLMTGPIRTPLAGGAQINVPVVLRALPQPPTMRGQTASATYAAPTTPDQIADWDYRFSYVYDRAAQDAVATQIDFNPPAPASGVFRADIEAPTPEAVLYAALAQFAQVYPAVSEATTQALAAIDGVDAKTDAPATLPVEAFLHILWGVADTYRAWAAAQPDTADAQGPLQGVTVRFEARLVGQTDKTQPAITEISGLTINGATALLNDDLTTITAASLGLTLPLPKIEILPDQWIANVVSAAGKDTVRFNYLSISGEAGDDPMRQCLAQAVTNRSMVMSGLNIFAYRAATATLKIVRNEDLLPDQAPFAQTNPAFVFSTPAVQFASPALPSLTLSAFALDGLQNAPASYQSYLDLFFTKLAVGAGELQIGASATATYAYSQIDSQPQLRTVAPVSLLLHTQDLMSASAPPGFVAALAGAVDQWRSTWRPTLGGGASLDLAFAIYPSGDGDVQPLLRIEALTLAATSAPVGIVA